MFRKTRLRLVALNSVVFFLLLNALGSTLYFSVKHRLYSQVDRELFQMAGRMKEVHFMALPERKRLRLPPRHGMLIWGQGGVLLLSNIDESLDTGDLARFHQEAAVEGLSNRKVGGYLYRVYTVPTQLVVSVDGQMKQASEIQMIYNLDSEQKMLDSLLFVIGVGGLTSIVIAVLAGLFLAKKALIPIQLSWAKQQQFVADASHELRTPLSVILVNLERLFRNPHHTIEQESESIFITIQETKRLNKLVTDLLTLARSNSDEPQIFTQRVKLDNLVRQSIQTFQQLADLKQIRVEAQIEQPVELLGDEERLKQLLVILMDNALKYTGEQGLITVSCKRSGGHVHLAVSDTGIGIPKEDLDQIFDRFFRGDKMRSRTTEGTGLGLSIAKWIVEAHGGKIRAESEPGAGTKISVSLPSRI